MAQVTNTTQLSLFDLFVAAIAANSTLSARFSPNKIHQYEPKHKSNSFTGFPYMVFDIPTLDSAKMVFDNSVVDATFTVSALIRVEYLARDNMLSYCNNFIKAITDYESTFEASGYFDVMVDLIGVDSNQVIDEKEVVEAVFDISFRSSVAR